MSVIYLHHDRTYGERNAYIIEVLEKRINEQPELHEELQQAYNEKENLLKNNQYDDLLPEYIEYLKHYRVD